MAYHIDISPPALLHTRNIYEWLRESSESRAVNWLRELRKAQVSLKEFPNRCPIAPEWRSFPVEVRQLLFATGGKQWRIIFGVSVDETGEQLVSIYRIRDSRQNRLEDLEFFGENYDE